MPIYQCFICGHIGNARTRHEAHFVPVSSGGVRVGDACNKCNWQMGAKTRGQYARWLREHPEERFPWPDGDRRPFMRRYLHAR